MQIGKELELNLTHSALPQNTGHPKGKRAQVIIAEEINLYKSSILILVFGGKLQFKLIPILIYLDKIGK